MLLTQTDRERIRDALWRFYDAAAAADMPETTRLATTIETWWPAILVALTADVTNAAPRASTGSSSRRSESPAAFATWTTTSGASCPTSRSPERDQRQQHERGRPAQMRRAPSGETRD